jgi:hypothetical protein
LKGQLVRVVSVSDEVVDNRFVNIVSFEDFKDTSGSMQVADSGLGLENAKDRVEVLDLLDDFFVFVTIYFNGQSDGTCGKLLLRKTIG